MGEKRDYFVQFKKEMWPFWEETKMMEYQNVIQLEKALHDAGWNARIVEVSFTFVVP